MNILTFDIEEWFVYQLYNKGGKDYFIPIIDRYLNEILDELDKNEIKATFFCLGILAREFPKVVKSIFDRGHHIGCHSDKHIFITSMTPDYFRDDCKKAKHSLEDLLGVEVNAYRAPSFTITTNTAWALDILIEEGFKYDSSIFPSLRTGGGFKSLGFNSPFTINTKSGSILEFPINYSSIGHLRFMYSGGGYFRAFPYSLIQRLTKKFEYNMCYFHIRDFDKEQKRVVSSRYFKSYYGIDSAFEKLKRYITEFEFISLENAIAQLDFDTLKRINL
jgi:peptidoglycan-N-acetylglucosamine deacetylase